MNLIVLSHMFPKTYNPQSGLFVEQQVRALKNLIEGTLTVISPVPWSPRFLWFKKRWADYGAAEKEGCVQGIKVYYPRFLVVPGKYSFLFGGISMYYSVRSLIGRIIESNRGKTVLQTHAILSAGLAGTFLKKKYKIRHVCTIHGSDINYYPFYNKPTLVFTKIALRGCDQIVTVSRKLQEKLQGIDFRIKNVMTVHNGADPMMFKRASKIDARRQLGLDVNEKIVLYVGNLVPVKRANNVIRAFSEIIRNDHRKNISLYLVGDGPEKANLVELCRNLEVTEKVLFVGRKEHAEIPLWLNSGDIFVLPSVNEGFPTIIPEAMMCGIPIVATDVGGVSEAIVNRRTGLLVESDNIRALREGIAFFLDNQSDGQEIVRNALAFADKLTWDNNARQYLNIYENVAGLKSVDGVSK